MCQCGWNSPTRSRNPFCLSLYTLFLIFSIDFPLLVTKGFTYAVPCLQGRPSWTVLHLVRDAQPSLPTPHEEGCFSWWRWSLSATTHSNYGPCSRLSGMDALTSVWGAEAPCHKPRWQNREMRCQLEGGVLLLPHKCPRGGTLLTPWSLLFCASLCPLLSLTATERSYSNYEVGKGI